MLNTLNNPADVIYALDIFGVMCFAVAGTIQAIRHRLDPLGAILIAAVTAIGGGTIRDLILDRPVFWLTSEEYVYVIVITSIIVQFFYLWFEKIFRILRITDAIGLATFTIIGVEAALGQGMSPLIAIFMGVMTSCFGGMVRDIVCNEVPLVLRAEIYISASIVGGLSYISLQKLGLDNSYVYIISGGIAFAVRMLAVIKQWNLPTLGKRDYG